MWLIHGLRAQRNIEKYVGGGSAQLGLTLNHFAMEGLNMFAVMFVHCTFASLAPFCPHPCPHTCPRPALLLRWWCQSGKRMQGARLGISCVDAMIWQFSSGNSANGDFWSCTVHLAHLTKLQACQPHLLESREEGLG